MFYTVTCYILLLYFINILLNKHSGVPRNFVLGGWVVCVQQIQLTTEDRENGDLGAVAP